MRPRGLPGARSRRSVPLSGALATPPTISSFDTTVAEPDVAIAAGGQATAVWQYDLNNTSLDNDDIVQSAERTIVPNFAGGTWGAAARVTEIGESAVNPVVAVDATGLATSVWYGTIAGESKIRAATRPNGGGWADHRPGSGPGMDTSLSPTPQIDLSPAGDAVVMWARYDGTNHLLEAATKPRGGPFGPVRVVKQGFTSGGQEHRVSFRPLAGVGFDNEGNGVATWIGYDYPAENYYIESAGFDAAAPRFAAVSVPTSGRPGAALAMTAAASDRWTATTVRWSFGDGATATGPSVAHAYARPGVYTVGVTATDAVGNVATVTRAVQITAAPGVDADGDGFFRGTNPGQDCDDGNARINPGATDVRGNRVDENCDGRRAPFLLVGATPKTTWSVLGSRLTLVELRVRGWAKGTKAELRCAGKGCKFKKVRVRGKPKRGVVNALKSLKGGKRTLRAGQTFEVRITRPKRIGRVSRYKLRANKIPSSKQSCLPPGARKPRRC